MAAISRPSSEGLERGPVERLEIDERVDVDLGFRKQPGTSGKPGKSGFPGGDLLRASGAANSIDGVQIHGWQPSPKGSLETALLLAVEIRTLLVSFLQESRDSRSKTAATESPDTLVLRVPPLLYNARPSAVLKNRSRSQYPLVMA